MNDVLITLINVLAAPVVIAFVTVFIKLYEKKSNLRISTLENQIAERNNQMKKDIGLIYNVISNLLATFEASRVYIIQPHPTKKYQFISVVYEVTNIGVMSVKTRFTNLPVENIPVFFGDISTRDFLWIKDITTLKGKRSRAYFSNLGTESLLIKQMSDDNNTYIGSIVIDFLTPPEDLKIDYAKTELQIAVDKIQFILPSID